MIFRHTWMIDKTRALTTQGSPLAKAIALGVLMTHVTDHWKRKTDECGDQLHADDARTVGHTVAEEDDGYGITLGMADYLSVPASEIDGFLQSIGTTALPARALRAGHFAADIHRFAE